MAGAWSSGDGQRSGCVPSPCRCWPLTILSHSTAVGCDGNRLRHCWTLKTASVHLLLQISGSCTKTLCRRNRLPTQTLVLKQQPAHLSEVVKKDTTKSKSDSIFCFATSLDPHMRKQHVRGWGEPVQKAAEQIQSTGKLSFFEWVVVQQQLSYQTAICHE